MKSSRSTTDLPPEAGCRNQTGSRRTGRLHAWLQRLEVCQRLKDAGETAHIPVLLTVGKLEPFKAEEGRRVRADSHIVKPFEASELLTAITRLEDRILPVGAERFTSKGSNRLAESNTDADTGWKSRLSFFVEEKERRSGA